MHFSETHKTVNIRNIYGMLLHSKEKANKAQENKTANGNGNKFVIFIEICLHVLNFIVIGYYTINIPEIFQVFIVLSLTVNVSIHYNFNAHIVFLIEIFRWRE